MTKNELALYRAWITLTFIGFLFGLHYGAGWSWQVSFGLALLDEIASKLYVISRQLERR